MQKTLEKYQIKYYQTFLRFFRHSLGILHPLRENIPHTEILNEIRSAKKNKFTEVGKAIIAKHALLSFFPEHLRKNKLIHIYIHKKLLHGDSSLSTRSKSALQKYYNSFSEELKNEVKKHSPLAQAMIRAIDKMLPEEEVDFYFDNYIKLMNVWKDSVLLNNYIFIDAIMDDFWISHNWNFNAEEKALLMTIDELFYERGKPFSLEFLEKNIEHNKNKLIEEIGQFKWITSKTRLRNMWKNFSKKGVNFSYSVNAGLLGLKSIFVILQIHPKTDIELFRYVLHYLANINFIFENWSQSSTIFYGNVYIPIENNDFILEFFARLKNIGTLLDFVLIPVEKINSSISIKTYDSKTRIYSRSYNYSSIEKFNDLDILDKIILYSLRKGGFIGYPLDDLTYHIAVVRDQISSKIQEIQIIISNLKENQIYINSSGSLLDYLLPEGFCETNPSKPIDYIKNSNLCIIENLYFFEKWLGVLNLLINQYSKGNVKDFDSLKTKNPLIFVFIRRIKQNLKHFTIKFFKKREVHQKNPSYSVKQIINRVLAEKKGKEIISQLIKEISSILFYYQTKHHHHNFNRKVLTSQLNVLESIANYTQEKLLKEYADRIDGYIERGLIQPNLPQSVQFQNQAYYDCDFYTHQIPKKIINQSKHKTRNIVNSTVGEFMQQLDSIGIKNYYRKNHWKLSKYLRFTGMSFIQTSYDNLFNYLNLYDFYTNKFVSLKPKMKEILSFSLKYFRNTVIKSPEVLSDHLNLDHQSAVSINNKRLFSLSRKIDKYSPPKALPDEMLSELSYLFHLSRERTTNYFLSAENHKIKNVGVEVNWPMFGLEEYIFSFKIKKEIFTHKTFSEKINTREFLCIPGVRNIKISTNTGYFQRNFIYFVFPFNSPAKNIFHSLEKWNYISDLKYIKLKTKNVWFNPNFLQSNTTRFSSWKLYATRIITKNIKTDSEPLSFHFQKGLNKSPTSPEYQLLRKIYKKNLRQLRNLPIFKDIQKMFFSGLIWYLPDLEKLIPLPHRVIIELYPVSNTLIPIFTALFMTAPISHTYLANFTVRKKGKEITYDGIYSELRFHDCNLSDFLDTIYKIGKYLKIKNIRITPSVINTSINEFVGKTIKNYPNLFDSFIWDTNQFRNIKIFSKSGPLTYKERYEQLSKMK